nr:hypothetical protein cemce18_00021 [uncultured bacterium]
MPQLAERFNSDFLIVAHKICKVHVYCCGSQAKNENIATCFQNLWYGKENSKVCYYQGALSAPDIYGTLWSEANGVRTYASSEQFVLNNYKCSLKEEPGHMKSNMERRMKFLTDAHILPFSNKRRERHEKLRANASRAKLSMFHNNRNQEMEVDVSNEGNFLIPV